MQKINWKLLLFALLNAISFTTFTFSIHKDTQGNLSVQCHELVTLHADKTSKIIHYDIAYGKSYRTLYRQSYKWLKYNYPSFALNFWQG